MDKLTKRNLPLETRRILPSFLVHSVVLQNSLSGGKVEMEEVEMEEVEMEELKLEAIEVTPGTFAEYGQVIEASPDGEEFGPRDAQLDLSKGIPRFYIMHLDKPGTTFTSLKHHTSVTRCLGSIGGHPWYLGVAKRSILDNGIDLNLEPPKNLCKARSGHLYVPPAFADVRNFKVSGSKFLKLNVGTWYAGPFFLADSMDFYCLELSDTNVVDNTTHCYRKEN